MYPLMDEVGNEIGDRGCKYITKLRLPNIKELGVGKHAISQETTR